MVAFNALKMKYILFIFIILFSFSSLANKYNKTVWINKAKCSDPPFVKVSDRLRIDDKGYVRFAYFKGKIRSSGAIFLDSTIGTLRGKIKNGELKMRFKENSDANLHNKLTRCKFLFVQHNGDNLESQITETKSKKINSSTGIIKGSQEDLIVNVGDRVFFGYDSADLDTDAQELLQDQAAWLNQNRDVSVTIEGHTDERSTFNFSLAIGERRAQAVKNYLIGLGIDPQRISTVSYGKSRPAITGSNDGAWAQNRRAVTIVN